MIKTTGTGNKQIKLTTAGTTLFHGIVIPNITGGFGENKKCILAKDISKIHEMPLKRVNEDIKLLVKNKRIQDGLHYIDLLSENSEVDTADLQIKSSNGQVNAFLLSERGYMSLIKYMNDDKSWEVMEEFVDTYFEMKKVIEEISENYSLRIENLTRIFSGVYPQEYGNVAAEILDFHTSLGKLERLDKRHKKYDATKYKQFTRDKLIEALTVIQSDVLNKDIVAIQLYSKELIIQLQNDHRITNNISDGKVIHNLKRNIFQVKMDAVELINALQQ